MLRWSILLVTFALWVGCLAIVYFQCKPVPMIGAEATARATLDRMFAENAIDRRAWNIYVDPPPPQFRAGSAGARRPAEINSCSDSRQEGMDRHG